MRCAVLASVSMPKAAGTTAKAEASRAMYQKAEYFKADNDKANAIAHYRRILSHPDWKKSGQASQSHQRLEELGIETGGGVIHNVN